MCKTKVKNLLLLIIVDVKLFTLIYIGLQGKGDDKIKRVTAESQSQNQERSGNHVDGTRPLRFILCQ